MQFCLSCLPHWIVNSRTVTSLVFQFSVNFLMTLQCNIDVTHVNKMGYLVNAVDIYTVRKKTYLGVGSVGGSERCIVVGRVKYTREPVGESATLTATKLAYTTDRAEGNFSHLLTTTDLTEPLRPVRAVKVTHRFHKTEPRRCVGKGCWRPGRSRRCW